MLKLAKIYVPRSVHPDTLKAARAFCVYIQFAKEIRFREAIDVKNGMLAGAIKALKCSKERRELAQAMMEEDRLDIIETFTRYGVFIDRETWQVNPILARNVLGINGVEDMVIANPSGLSHFHAVFRTKDGTSIRQIILNGSAMNARLMQLTEETMVNQATVKRKLVGPEEVIGELAKRMCSGRYNPLYPLKFISEYLFARWAHEMYKGHGNNAEPNMLDSFMKTSAIHEAGHLYLNLAGLSRFDEMVIEERRAYLTEMAFGNPLFALLDNYEAHDAHAVALQTICAELLDRLRVIPSNPHSFLELARMDLETLNQIAEMMLRRDLLAIGQSVENVMDVQTLLRIGGPWELATPLLANAISNTDNM